MDSNLLYIETANSIEEQIKEGVFKEGDKLPSERELTTMFQVSRNVVRQAITILREKGFVIVRPGKGAYVTNPKDKLVTDTLKRVVEKYDSSLEDILEVREGLETSIIQKAVSKASDSDIANLKKIFHSMEQSKNFANEFVEDDLNFHLALAQCTKNSIYSILVRSFFDLTEKSFFTITRVTNNHMDIINKAQTQHWQIIKAIEEKDEELALSTIKEHMCIFNEEIEFLRREKLL